MIEERKKTNTRPHTWATTRSGAYHRVPWNYSRRDWSLHSVCGQIMTKALPEGQEPPATARICPHCLMVLRRRDKTGRG